MISSLRFTALALTLVLSACSTSNLPKVNVTHSRLDAGTSAHVADDKVAIALASAQSAYGNLANSRDAYNTAVESFVMELQRRVSPRDWTKPVKISSPKGAWEISFDQQPLAKQGQPEWSPGFFDHFTPAHAFDLKRFYTHVEGKGVGAPFVLTLEDTSAIRAERTFRPNNGIYAPGTVLLQFGKPAQNNAATPVRMRILNSMNVREANVAGSERHLAYDITSMVEANLNNNYIVKNGLAGLLRPDKRAEDLGLFGLNTFDPNKIPVVFVHGLNSSPKIWSNIVNEIYANPELNARYQPLLFIYPSGLSVPGAAARFRDSLVKYRAKWDPKGSNANFNRMIIVGHSMGGLLTRLQVIDTGEELRKAFFTRPIAENGWLTAEEKIKYQQSLVFKPVPFVKRVVFVAVPHRGSKIADIGIVQMLVRLIKLPINATDLVARAMTEGPDIVNPELARYRSLGLRSVDMLSPDHPYFKALDARPITVPYHSIIGDRGKSTAKERSDGIVPYWSAHLNQAQSERVVPYGHSCTSKHETLDEIVRILKLHAAKN
ncbi:MAG: hypothetical protein RL693_7 [Verrucomicrobiota bacterium]|jgi:pimeloyl-ACP methyl ester carboxylesterase